MGALLFFQFFIVVLFSYWRFSLKTLKGYQDELIIDHLNDNLNHFNQPPNDNNPDLEEGEIQNKLRMKSDDKLIYKASV